MRNILMILMVFFIGLTQVNAMSTECKDLLSNYKRVPDPSIKTMKQLERWVKRKVKDGNAKAVSECLVVNAADNPNKATVAGQ